MTRPPRMERRAILFLAAVAVLATGAAACSRDYGSVEPSGTEPSALPSKTQPGEGPRATVPPAPAATPDDRSVFAYYFYWYDSRNGSHLLEQYGIRDHLPATPTPDWRNVAWHVKQMEDMEYAGIDALLAVYWGDAESWSIEGLEPMARARGYLKDLGKNPPAIGMFFDTTIVAGRDLTTPGGKSFFCRQISDFFQRVPPQHWARVNGKPVIWLFTSDWTTAVDQSTFDHVYREFEAEFGVRPYIVREVSWDYPILRWEGGVTSGTRVRDYTRPIVTDNNYLWGAAMHGYVDRGGVAAVGPGFDDTLVPGRGGFVREREDGEFYRTAFQEAIDSGKRLIALETWNEIHEGSSICETLEYGRRYLDLTREMTARFREFQ